MWQKPKYSNDNNFELLSRKELNEINGGWSVTVCFYVGVTVEDDEIKEAVNKLKELGDDEGSGTSGKGQKQVQPVTY